MNIIEMREDGATWQHIADVMDLGSETSARRHHARALRVGHEDPTAPRDRFVPDVPRTDPVAWRFVGADLERILFVSDMHIPYENKETWSLMMAAAADFAPSVIVVIGDFGDFKAVSSHLKDPIDKTRMKWEVEQVSARLDELDALGAYLKLYVAGNHEDRLQRYLQEKAPELFDFMNVPTLLNLKARGWDYTAYKQHAKVGALYVTHDVGAAGVGAVRKALDVFMHSVVTGHSHRLQYVVEGDAVGGARVSVAFGWGGDIEEVDYMSRAAAGRNWAQGFGIGYLNPETQSVYLVPVPIVLGTCVVEGKLYTVQETV